MEGSKLYEMNSLSDEDSQDDATDTSYFTTGSEESFNENELSREQIDQKTANVRQRKKSQEHNPPENSTISQDYNKEPEK